DAWIGWSKEQLPCRRHLLANNARFCILADPHQLPNLATRALALCCARLSDDWLARWEHPIVAVESFVDGQLFRGTAYKAAGWTRLDDTSGYARVAEDFYERHERPKQLWVRALDAKAWRRLCAQTLPPILAGYEKPPPPQRQRWPLPPRRLVSLVDKLPKDMPDPRGSQGRWPRWRTVLAIIVLAKLCGVQMGQRQIAEFPASSLIPSAAPCAAAAILTIPVITMCLRKALFSGRWRRWTRAIRSLAAAMAGPATG